jgi:hypothetical protein
MCADAPCSSCHGASSAPNFDSTNAICRQRAARRNGALRDGNMDSADGVTTHAIWGPTNGLPCKETIEDWQRLNFMSKSRTVKDTKRILVEVSNYTGCPAAQGGTLQLRRGIGVVAFNSCFPICTRLFRSHLVFVRAVFEQRECLPVA